MNKHKSEDYRLQAIKYYLKINKSIDEVCEIFDCNKKSLSRWVNRYRTNKNVKRQSRNTTSYKVKNKHVKR